MKKWIIGNWKMNGSLNANLPLLRALAENANDACCAGVTVPYPYLMQAQAFLNNSKALWGAQDVSRFDGNGAYTGEVSAAMLADTGCRIVLVGHSERRRYFGEDNTALAQKISHVRAAGLTPIVCVGETLAERQSGTHQAVIEAQLNVFKNMEAPEVVIAYEPVWAIGTGEVADEDQITAMHSFIYAKLLSILPKAANITILYGGSVNSDNAATILKLEHVDGALVGGASLNADSFAKLIRMGSEA